MPLADPQKQPVQDFQQDPYPWKSHLVYKSRSYSGEKTYIDGVVGCLGSATLNYLVNS